MSTTLKVLSAKKVIANYQINQGEQLIIEARAQSNYQLVDDKTGFAPDNIITKRDGKDLKIYLNDGDMSEDIIIKDYYGDEIGETTNLLVGKHENGSIYAYIPESGLQPDAVSLLADQAVAPQALGGEELVSAFWAFNPWWLLALAPLAAGIAIAAHDGGNNSGGGDLNTQADGATKLVEEAEAKAKALDDKIKELEADGNISAEDKATLDALKADADAAKAKADEAVKGLPADNAAKDELQGRVDAIDNSVPDVTPDQTDSSNWGVDTDGWIENDSTADNPPDTDPSDESGEDNTPQLDPMVIVTGRTVLSNPTNAVMTKIRDKNLNVPTTQIQKVGSQAQFVTGEEDNTVVVGKGDRDNISGKNSITNGLIQTNGGSDKVVITNNSINTVIDTGADNDSVDIYGNLRHTGATAPESKIDTGNGDDVLTIRGRITGLKNQLMMGDGDDTVIVAGGATGNTTAQNNMQTKTNWNAIDLGEGNDKLSMGEKGPGNIQYTDIQAGIGDDVVILKPNRGKGDLLWVNVDLGDGNDSIVVAATDIRNVYISGGAGNDTIDLSASSTQTDATRSRVISSKVDGGEGNDHIILGKIDYVDDYPVDVTGGAGDDVITFTQDYAPFLTSNRIGASISGGDGFDTVAIKGTAMISLASGTAGTQKLPEGIINFESIDMTASGGQTVKLTASDVLANSGMLYIAGDSSDTVDLGNDGSSSLGGFTKTAETTARIALDGKEHTYTAYSNGDVKVYIDDQITNII
ncbi:hypothetical protein PHA51_08660 [Rodentibacter pneumotropicus]|uniref:GA-like domain-containing protein n=1 Tax=Rodentibacter pneumotropicus TaxID=758 RepID=UPI00232F61AE|nr:hypothetical protein [Rodentibacter pneumotropicus]MDC2826094.1 hypothetical protein [Rodentibacter pneumotropicus]